MYLFAFNNNNQIHTATCIIFAQNLYFHMNIFEVYSIQHCYLQVHKQQFCIQHVFSWKTHIIPYQYILSSLVCSLIVISPFVTFSGHCCWKKTSPPFIWQQTQSKVRLQQHSNCCVLSPPSGNCGAHRRWNMYLMSISEQ